MTNKEAIFELIKYRRILEKDSTIDVEPFDMAIKALECQHGEWVRHNTYHGDDTSGFVDPDWRCSECDGKANVNVLLGIYELTDFCPHCGADMRGEKNERVH